MDPVALLTHILALFQCQPSRCHILGCGHVWLSDMISLHIRLTRSLGELTLHGAVLTSIGPALERDGVLCVQIPKEQPEARLLDFHRPYFVKKYLKENLHFCTVQPHQKLCYKKFMKKHLKDW